MNEKLNLAKELFYNHDYKRAIDIFLELKETYEAGLCFFLLKDLNSARKFFEIKKNDCPASNFGLLVINIIEGKEIFPAKFFQIRSFLEIYINLMIENSLFDWAQKVIDHWGYFTSINCETPKFIARVLNANNYNRTVHFFAQNARKVCAFDAEIFYIEALVYLEEKNIKEAKKCLKECLKFAPEYFPVIKLKKELETKMF